MKGLFFSAVVMAGGVYTALAGWLYFNQRTILYLPDPSTPTPASAGFPDMNVVRIKAADGLDLYAWYRAAKSGKPTILYFHGNAGNLFNHSWIARPFIDRGYGMLLIEYRGYGGNPGSPTESGLYADGEGAVAYLKNLGIPEADMILFGQSLGTGVAVELATRFTPKTLILQSPYTSIAAAGQYHYWYMPVQLLIKDRFDSRSKIGRIRAPLLVIYGDRDKIIPARFSIDLYKAANGPKKIIAIKDAGHNDLAEAGGIESVLAFLETLRK